LVSAFATSYFPSIGYLKSICAAENTLIDLGEHCKKQTERNRCSILTSNGLQHLTVPIIRPNGNKSATAEIKISYVEAWERDHCRAITAAYAHAPYFEHYSKEIFSIIGSKSDKLIDLNTLILNQLKVWFELPMDAKLSETYLESPETDFRDFQFDALDKTYIQVDFGQPTFVPNLSILDALFCLGPMARNLIIAPHRI
jgi:hypothetical protein